MTSCSYAVGTSFFLRAVLLSTFILLFTFFLCFYVLFHFCCSQAQAFENSCTSSTFSMAILNGTCSLRSAKSALRSEAECCLTKSYCHNSRQSFTRGYLMDNDVAPHGELCNSDALSTVKHIMVECQLLDVRRTCLKT